MGEGTGGVGPQPPRAPDHVTLHTPIEDRDLAPSKPRLPEGQESRSSIGVAESGGSQPPWGLGGLGVCSALSHLPPDPLGAPRSNADGPVFQGRNFEG